MTAFLGILMLDTAFPRVPGDAGNPESYASPVRIRVVPGAESSRIVSGARPDPALIRAFVDAAITLEAEGAVGIVSTCGFLVHVQDDIARAVRIPVMVSALSLVPLLQKSLGGKPLGILTARLDSLMGGALQAAGIDPGTVHAAGMEDCPAFTGAILAAKVDQPAALDTRAIEAHCLALARDMLARVPSLGGIVLECGNLPPHASAIRRATGLPVWSILNAADLLWHGARREPH